MEYEGSEGYRGGLGSMVPNEGYVKEPMGWVVYETADEVNATNTGRVIVSQGNRRVYKAPVS
jgi:hypothetical protein